MNKNVCIPKSFFSYCLNNGLDLNDCLILEYIIKRDLSTALNISTDNPMLNMGETAIKRRCNKLKQKRLIEISKISDKQAFDALNNGYLKGCLFCGYNKSFLDKHHYPIRVKDKGTETIEICSNCHREFHTMTDYERFYKATSKIIKEWILND